MGRRAIDLTGQWFGRLEVLNRVEAPGAGRAVWRCRCQCGVQSRVMSHNLRTGRTVSCGCALADFNKARRIRERLRPIRQRQQWTAPQRPHRKPMGVMRRLTYQGRTQGLQEWAREIGMKYQTIQYRLDNGWSIERAMTTPSRKRPVSTGDP